MKTKIRKIKNKRELNLLKANIKAQQIHYEENMIKKSVKLIGNVSDGIKDLAFEMGSSMAITLISKLRKRKSDVQ